MADKLMYIPNKETQNCTFVDYNYWLKRLDTITQLNEPTNQNLIKALKLLSQRIRKCYYKTLGTGEIKIPM